MTTMTRPATLAAVPPLPVAGPVAVRFVEPLPGFDGHVEFGLVPVDPDGILFALRSLTDPTLRFVLTPADTFFDDYDPPLAGVAATLGAHAGDTRVLLMLTIPGDLADATANLRAPIVVCGSTGAAVQVVLDDAELSMHAPILPLAPPA